MAQPCGSQTKEACGRACGVSPRRQTKFFGVEARTRNIWHIIKVQVFWYNVQVSGERRRNNFKKGSRNPSR